MYDQLESPIQGHEPTHYRIKPPSLKLHHTDKNTFQLPNLKSKQIRSIVDTIV